MEAKRDEDDKGYSYTLELNGNSGTAFIKKPITDVLLAEKEADIDRILTDVLEKCQPKMNVHLAQTDKGWELTPAKEQDGDDKEDEKGEDKATESSASQGA